MKGTDRLYRGKQWADDERNQPARRVAVGIGLVLAAALIILAVLAVLAAAGPQ